MLFYYWWQRNQTQTDLIRKEREKKKKKKKVEFLTSGKQNAPASQTVRPIWFGICYQKQKSITCNILCVLSAVSVVIWGSGLTVLYWTSDGFCHRIGRIQTVASKQNNTRTQVQEDTHTTTIDESVGWSVIHSFSQSVSQSDRHRNWQTHTFGTGTDQLTEKQSLR